MPNPSNEVWLLAEHHEDILRSRFPDHGHVLTDLTDAGLHYWLSVTNEEDRTILEAEFTPSCVKIYLDDFPVYGDVVFDYADPRFTDNTIAEIIERDAWA